MVLEKEWLLPMEEKFLLEEDQREERKLVFLQNFVTKNND
jgi:hypothetical protein